MILRLTQKLGTKIKVGRLSERPLDENPYADWSCHVFTAGRTQYIIASNTSSLYSCVMYGKGITDDSRFIQRMLRTIREFMEDDGQAFAYRRFIAPASSSVTFAKSLNRSMTGSMNDLIKFAKHWLAEGDLSPHDVGFKLNDILLSALATTKTQGYGKPNEAFRAMLGSQSAVLCVTTFLSFLSEFSALAATGRFGRMASFTSFDVSALRFASPLPFQARNEPL